MIVSGRVRTLSPIETASQTSPHCFARPGRIGRKTTGHPFHPGRERPQQAAQPRTGELRRPEHQRQLQVDVAGVEVGAEREGEHRHDDRRRQRPLPVGPVDRPEQEQDRPDPPHEPGDVPRQQRPGREERQHPRRIDVRQERPGRVVRVAAVEPDPDARPVRPRVRAARVAPRDEPRQDHREDQAEQDDGGDPARVAQPRRLAPQGPSEDARPAPRAAIDDVGQVDDDATATAGRARDGLEAGGLALVGHGAGILPRRYQPAAAPPVRRLSSSRLSSREHARSLAWSVADGTVIIIGGAEDKVRDRVILNRFVALAGGPDATIAVISTASSLGLEAGERYRAVFGELGVKHVRPLHAVTRPQANDEAAVARRARRDGRLPDRRQPAPAVVDHRRDAPRGRDPRPLPARRGRGRARRPGRRRCRAT